jgi:GntR family transcriptional repressor for pyruvate dehydrogenase complex
MTLMPDEHRKGSSMFKSVAKSEKVSDNIIAQIRDSILSGRLKPGDRLASEKELTTQFEVSKATMREALRVLEVMGLIEIRKGTGGGTFVAEVDMRTTINSIINFLHFKPVSIREITMLRYMIEPTVARIAATKVTGKDIQYLRDAVREHSREGESEVSREISFHRYLARMAGNTILVLTIDFIDNLLSAIKANLRLGPDFYEQVRCAHENILECLIQRDPDASEIAMSNDLLDVGRYLSRITGSPSFEPEDLGIGKGNHGINGRLSPDARIVNEGDPLLKTEGVKAERVGSSNLFMVAFNGRAIQ